MKTVFIAGLMRAGAPVVSAALLFSATVLSPAAGSPTGVQHAVVVGVDGLSPDGVSQADAPNLKRLRKQGAWTFHARGVMPTSSSPNLLGTRRRLISRRRSSLGCLRSPFCRSST